jgi:hypothetical protein
MHFISFAPAIDYLSVTTFEEEIFSSMVLDSVERDNIEETSRMQYQGQTQAKSNGHFFWGVADQGGRQHYLIQASGAYSDKFGFYYFTVKPSDSRVTRIDLQLTLPQPDWYASRHLIDWLRSAEWKGRQRKITAVDGGGNDTVYIGSRSSDRYIRIYTKDSKWLRFEIEYKGDRARAVAQLIRDYDYRATISGILHRELNHLPQHPIIQGFKTHLQHDPLDIVVQKPESNTYRWFIKTVLPALRKLLNDHDLGERTRATLLDVLDTEDKSIIRWTDSKFKESKTQ